MEREGKEIPAMTKPHPVLSEIDEGGETFRGAPVNVLNSISHPLIHIDRKHPFDSKGHPFEAGG
jgi:hypothetical protein